MSAEGYLRNTNAAQKKAWGYYNLPGSPVPEVRYVVGWHADQMTRLDWDVLIDGSEEWQVTVGSDDEDRVISTLRDDGEQNLTEASMELLQLIDWSDTNVKAIDTNLFVAGEGDYVQTGDGWQVVSTVDPKRKEKLTGVSVPFLWPHPADPARPDAPLFAVLELLDDLTWLNRQSRTQSRQRALISGIVGTADGFDDDKGDFWSKWNASLRARMDNPDDLSPIHISGALELVKDGINWVAPPTGYDQMIDRRIQADIQRIAYGLPIPPEILLGMQAASRATAFQMEASGYRAHIEPSAWTTAQVAEDALSLLLEDVETVEVRPNPSAMLARKNSVQDVKDAWDRGLVTPEYVREVLGIPEDAAPDPEKDGIAPAGPGTAPSDPSNVAADEPVNASASPDLSDLLADIDSALASELAGATVMAVDRARQRLGAAARVDPKYRDNPALKKLSNSELAVTLGFDGLSGARIDIGDRIAEPVDAAARWWVRRVGEAWAQASELIPGWSGQGDWVTESVAVLSDALVRHIMDTLSEPEPPPMQAVDIRAVVDAAAGGVTVGVR